MEALHADVSVGRRRRISDEDLERVGRAIQQGPQSHGFPDERWTHRQVGLVIQRMTGVSYHPSHVGRIVRRMGWSLAPPDP
jgi:putative transposase